MKSVLWIPCYNEWTQEVIVPRWPQDVDVVMRHTIYETLKLLGPKIEKGIFSEVMITDDGSTDDTREGIERFIEESGFHKSVFRIIGWSDNIGKMGRFFEALEQAHDRSIDVLAMTDADMLLIGEWNVFERLAFSDDLFNRFNPGRGMYVSHQRETKPSGWYFEVSDQQTSGTRSVIIASLQAKLSNLRIDAPHALWTGYGLEILLNSLWLGCAYVNKSSHVEKMPLFCPAFRKWHQSQHEDIVKTRKSLLRHCIPVFE